MFWHQPLQSHVDFLKATSSAPDRIHLHHQQRQADECILDEGRELGVPSRSVRRQLVEAYAKLNCSGESEGAMRILAGTTQAIRGFS
jgi:hypothetical protein